MNSFAIVTGDDSFHSRALFRVNIDVSEEFKSILFYNNVPIMVKGTDGVETWKRDRFNTELKSNDESSNDESKDETIEEVAVRVQTCCSSERVREVSRQHNGNCADTIAYLNSYSDVD